MSNLEDSGRWWTLENLVRRLSIREFADLSWMPAAYQRYVQEALVFSYQAVPRQVFEPWAEHMCQFLKRHDIKTVTILGAGAGGPIFRLQKYFLARGLRVQFELTDLAPNAALMDKADDLLTYEPRSVDALEARPAKANHATMMIGCFHHFNPDQVRVLLENFRAQKGPVYILEISTRNWLNLLSNLLFWLPCTLAAPFIRPFSWARILFSWFIPVFPLMFVLDGVLSGLRTYSRKEFLALAAPDPAYAWEVSDFTFIGGLFKVRSHVGR